MLLSKQPSKVNLFLQKSDRVKLIYTKYLKAIFTCQKIHNVIFLKKIVKQALSDIILIFRDMAGLDKNLQEWKQLCRKDCENEYDYLQIDRFTKVGGGEHIFQNCNKTIYKECTPQMKLF